MTPTAETSVHQAYALLIGIDEAEGLPSCPFAAAEVTALGNQLAAVGVAKDRLVTLCGRTATRSGIESRLRRLVQAVQPGATIWFVFAGPAFVEAGCTFLACSDTLADDRIATSIALDAVWRQLDASGATLHVVLDAPHVAAELSDLIERTRHVALVASSGAEPAHAANGRRLWLQLVGDALAGQAPDAVRDGQLIAASLHEWIVNELPRRIRKHVTTPTAATPALFGHHEATLAQVATATEPTAKLNLKHLRRITFRGAARQRLKDLSGFQKNFKLPEAATPSAQRWVYKIAAADLQAVIDKTYDALREQFGFKRKDLEANVGVDGLGFIRTPKFDFTVSVSLDPDDPTGVIWRREVSQIAKVDILTSDAFRSSFGPLLDTLQFDFAKPIDVPALVDRIEDDPPPGTTVRVASDGSTCEISVHGFAGRVHVERTSLRIEGRAGLSPASLLAQFLRFQAEFSGRKGLRALGL